MKMKSKLSGKNTLEVEVTHISIGGIWLLLKDKEFFLPFEQFPWFKDATVGEIHNVQMVNGDQLRWPELGKDLSVESLGRPETVPSLNRKVTRHL
jgi:hypothetical protein